MKIHERDIPPGTKIDPSWEIIRDTPEECEGFREYKCKNQTWIEGISNLLYKTNEDAHFAIIISAVALIVAVLALFV